MCHQSGRDCSITAVFVSDTVDIDRVLHNLTNGEACADVACGSPELIVNKHCTRATIQANQLRPESLLVLS